MRFDVISLFPEQFRILSEGGVVARALQRGIAELHLWNPRDFSEDPRRRVDDRPYGGGPGMVMLFQPLAAAIRAVRREAPGSRVVYLSPQGRRLDQAAVEAMAEAPGWILLAGRYEGIDERVIEQYVDQEWSIGDYVLSGGELPAMVLMDAVIRLLPGALGDQQSALQDSYADGLLDCPHFSRPEDIQGLKVPEVLLSGDHAAIARWRRRQSIWRTWLRRPDLLARVDLSREEQQLLREFNQARQHVEPDSGDSDQ